MPRKPPPPNGGAPWQTPPRRRQQPRRDPRRSWPSGSRSCHSVRVSHRAGWASAARPTGVSILDACCVRSTAGRTAGARWRASRCLRARPGCRTCGGMGKPRPTWQLWRRRRGKQAAPPRRRPRLSKPCGTSFFLGGGAAPRLSAVDEEEIHDGVVSLRGPAGRGARHAGQVRHHQHRDG